MISKVKGQGCEFTCLYFENKRRNTKIGTKVAHPMYSKAHQFQGQKVKGEVHQLRPELHYIFRMKLGTQMEHEDPYHRQARRDLQG